MYIAICLDTTMGEFCLFVDGNIVNQTKPNVLTVNVWKVSFVSND